MISGFSKQRIAAAVLTGVLWAAWPGAGLLWAQDEPTPHQASPAQIAALIDQLGDRAFAAREAATSHLLRVGIVARPLLLQAAKSPDAEVRLRARRILETVVEADFQQRLAAFAADEDGSRNLDMPGWGRFSSDFGADRAARSLFVELQRAEPELMQAYEADPHVALQMLDERSKSLEAMLRMRFGNQVNQIPLGSIAALLMVGSDARLAVPGDIEGRLYMFLYQVPFHNAMTGGNYQAIVRALLARWIAKPMSNNVANGYQKVMLSMRYEMKEGLPAAEHVAQQKEAPPWYRVYGVLALGKLGSEAQLPVLDPLLADKTPFVKTTVNDKERSVEVRDVALAVSIHLAGHDPKAFGFEHLEPRSDYLFNPKSLYFESDEQREGVLLRFRNRADEKSSQ